MRNCIDFSVLLERKKREGKRESGKGKGRERRGKGRWREEKEGGEQRKSRRKGRERGRQYTLLAIRNLIFRLKITKEKV